MSTRPTPTHDVTIDIEAGGLRREDRPWEIGLVIDGPDPQGNVRDEELHHYYVADFSPAEADPMALRMAGFYERHPRFRLDGVPLHLDDHGLIPGDPDRADRVVTAGHMPEYDLSWYFERLIRGARIIVCNPVYDEPRLAAMLGRAGIAWTGFYRPVCATTWAAGVAGLDPSTPNEEVGAAFGVSKEQFGTAHTALTDALYGRALYHAARIKAGLGAPTW